MLGHRASHLANHQQLCFDHHRPPFIPSHWILPVQAYSSPLPPDPPAPPRSALANPSPFFRALKEICRTDPCVDCSEAELCGPEPTQPYVQGLPLPLTPCMPSSPAILLLNLSQSKIAVSKERESERSQAGKEDKTAELSGSTFDCKEIDQSNMHSLSPLPCHSHPFILPLLLSEGLKGLPSTTLLSLMTPLFSMQSNALYSSLCFSTAAQRPGSLQKGAPKCADLRHAPPLPT